MKKNNEKLTPAHGVNADAQKKKDNRNRGIFLSGAVVFALLLIFTAVLLFAVPADMQSIKKENRTAAELPAFTWENIKSGKFTSGFEEYLSDHVGLRGILQARSKDISGLTGFDCKDGEFLSYKKDIGTQTQDDTLLMYHDHKLLEIFYEDDNITKEYISALDRLADSVWDGAELYSMIVPTQLEFDDPYYAGVQSSQKEAIEQIYSGISDKYECADAYGALNGHASEYIYFRSDHHWTQLGAYYAYRSYCEKAGLDPVEIDEYEKETLKTDKGQTDMLGSLYNYTGYSKMRQKPDKLEWYNTDPDKKLEIYCKGRDGEKLASYDGTLFDMGIKEPGYSFYMGGDHHYTKIINPDAEKKRTLFMIRDSYANAIMPWLINNYSKIIAYDPRSQLAELPEIIAGEEVDDVLVLNYIFSSGFTDYCNSLINAADKIKESLNGIKVPGDETVGYHDNLLVEVFRDNEDNRKGYVEGLNEAAEALGENVEKYIMVSPGNAAFDDVILNEDRESQPRVIDDIYSELEGNYSCIDVYGTLKKHRDEYVFFHTDHHWTQLGAYYAYLEYCDIAGFDPVDINDYKKLEAGEMLGSLYKQKPEKGAEKNPDIIEWYNTDPYDEILFTPLALEDGELKEYSVKMFRTDLEDMQYSFFMGGDHKYVKIENPGIPDGKTLLLAHDSYANALIPWLINHYKYIISYDMLAEFDMLNELIADESIDDFLVVNYIASTASDRYAVDTKKFAQQLGY